MKMTITRAALMNSLQNIVGVVEKKQTMPILANVLISVTEHSLTMTATDSEIELICTIPLEHPAQSGTFTVSARKLFDICRALPDDAVLQFSLEENHLLLRSGKSRFQLVTLPVSDFPNIEHPVFTTEFSAHQHKLKKLFSHVHFAMGQQDVRHYLNGALFNIENGSIHCVATDGHRMAFSTIDNITMADDLAHKVILPRKSVMELIRLLDSNTEKEIKICIGENHFRLSTPEFIFTSRLINAPYPDYQKLIPKKIDSTIMADRSALKEAFSRASILSNEKFRGIRLQLEHDLMRIVANNPEQEEAEELVHLSYQGNTMEIAFNVTYLLDVISALDSEHICWSFSDPYAGVLIEPKEKDGRRYVVMPMRL